MARETLEFQGYGSGERWLSLGEACRLLGVDESTLRRWADGGHVRAYRTPGGHRRFSETDLRSLLGRRQGRPRLSSPGSRPAVASSSYPVGEGEATSWYGRLPQEGRTELASLGRRLLAGLVACLETPRCQDTLDEAQAAARQYGRELGRWGVELQEAVASFLNFRHRVEEMAEMLGRRAAVAEEDGEFPEMMGDLGRAADRLLLALIEGHRGAGRTACCC